MPPSHATTTTTTSSPTAPMSTGEVIAKKRGRPRKTALPDSDSPSSPDPAKPSTARKSAVPKTSSIDPTKPRTRKTKSPAVEAPEPKISASPVPTAAVAAAATPSSPSLTPESKEPLNQTTTIPPPLRQTPTPIQHRQSKILTAVRELSTKASPAPKPSPSIKPVSHPRTPSKTSIPKAAAKATTTTPVSPPKPAPHNAAAAAAAAAAPTPPKPPAPKPPLEALNSKIVSDLSTPSGARPSASAAGKTQLPPNYKPVARKVTMVIVALPIAIVTSYVLWQRLVNGEERKVLIRDIPEADTKGKGPELG